MKTAVVALVCCVIAGAAGAGVAVVMRPGARPQEVQQVQQGQQPAPMQPAVNCASCNLPPVSNCIPSGLSWDCQWCYVQQINAAGIFPSPVVWVVNGKEPRWAYYGPVAGTAGNGPVYLPVCP